MISVIGRPSAPTVGQLQWFWKKKCKRPTNARGGGIIFKSFHDSALHFFPNWNFSSLAKAPFSTTLTKNQIVSSQPHKKSRLPTAFSRFYWLLTFFILLSSLTAILNEDTKKRLWARLTSQHKHPILAESINGLKNRRAVLLMWGPVRRERQISSFSLWGCSELNVKLLNLPSLSPARSL